uniref:Uncharacterized protein n=1 Tax=Siphoviridae sp. ct0hG5 TaxID=2826269 RepID=A0A8S5QJU2_9CAUD|nr:MAG TPA: hypothetical protein [Siphoviridae sp. ct0hG5]
MSTTTVMPTTGTPRTPSASARISQLHKVIGQVPACSNGKGEAIWNASNSIGVRPDFTTAQSHRASSRVQQWERRGHPSSGSW